MHDNRGGARLLGLAGAHTVANYVSRGEFPLRSANNSVSGSQQHHLFARSIQPLSSTAGSRIKEPVRLVSSLGKPCPLSIGQALSLFSSMKRLSKRSLFFRSITMVEKEEDKERPISPVVDETEEGIEMSVSSDCSDAGSIDEEGDESGHFGNDDQRVKDKIAEHESRMVLRLRVLVILVLLCAACAVSVVVFYITKRAQVDSFQTQYQGTSEKIVEAFQGIVKHKLGAISSVGVAIIAHGVDHLRSWPFVTLSSFQQRSSTARSLSGALFVSINPYVNETQRVEWERYVVSNDSYWIEEGFQYQKQLGLDIFEPTLERSLKQKPDRCLQIDVGDPPRSSIYTLENGNEMVEDPGPGPYMPVWQTSPVLKRPFVNQNLFHNALYANASRQCLESEQVIFGGFDIAPVGGSSHPDTRTSLYASLLSISAEQHVEYQGDPMSAVYLPVFSSFKTSRTPVAVLIAIINWGAYFKNVLPPNVKGIVVVLDNHCNEPFTYQIDGEDVKIVGRGDLHAGRFDAHERTADFSQNLNIADGTKYGLFLNQEECPITLKIYPSQTYYDIYNSETPVVVTFAVAMVFVFTAFMFLIYDRLVERRQHIVLNRAATSSAIVSSLFPKNVRERLMQDNQKERKRKDKQGGLLAAPHHRLKSFLTNSAGEGEAKDFGLQPIADLFPHTTVLFADIAGFTAWSSTREPAQVFILLQTLYQAFDVLAKKRKVFKVETIGDSYVAVTGLPEPQARHAVIMARFAGECMIKLQEIVTELEVSLGPDTGDLSMRFGLHSGPVTAGVLRGDRARFQLFGDTVNTAARMESTGRRDRIQCSKATADLLIRDGKAHWVKPRADSVVAKGKGVLTTFWLAPYTRRQGSASSSQTGGSELIPRGMLDFETSCLDRQERMVEWIRELLLDHIRAILLKRKSSGGNRKKSENIPFEPKEGTTALDEVAEVIRLPEFNPKSASEREDRKRVEVSEIVNSQLRDFVSAIASMYHPNPFHNWEHACHVTMSVNKLLMRIVAPDVEMEKLEEGACNHDKLASQIHAYTHGINSDPLGIFAIIFSAIIHDVDHRGVSNPQLMTEEQEMAAKFHNKSIAEQHSFHLAWDLLMSERFDDLRACLFADKDELLRFRQITINVVMATDIFDKELNDLRKKRWDKAFCNDAPVADINNLRATIVIEHIIQASDVSHTMQHWHVYRKWNKKLFQEMYLAFRAGRMGTDPSTFWYASELGFFDNYIIPLAKKLQDCAVFGVSSDEYLNYALQNRAEWEDRGQEIVEEMKDEFMHPRAFRSSSIGSRRRGS